MWRSSRRQPRHTSIGVPISTPATNQRNATRCATVAVREGDPPSGFPAGKNAPWSSVVATGGGPMGMDPPHFAPLRGFDPLHPVFPSPWSSVVARRPDVVARALIVAILDTLWT